MLIVTYAGFLGESDLLESIYQRGMGGRRIDAELECYEADELFLESHTAPTVAGSSLLRAAAENITARAVLEASRESVGEQRVEVYRSGNLGSECVARATSGCKRRFIHRHRCQREA